jgi:uncharacterized protein
MNARAPDHLPQPLAGKVAACTALLRDLNAVAVAYSGGVDSHLLLTLAVDALGPERAPAILAVGPIFPAREQLAARRQADQAGAKLLEVVYDPLDDEPFTANPSDRCYHCKRAIFTHLAERASSMGIEHLASGTHADDAPRDRPGLRAERELGVRQPLREAKLTKTEIREVSRRLGLATHDAPSLACLASRVPYGTRIVADDLARIDRAEEALLSLGFGQVRLRLHGPVARIEVPPERVADLLACRRGVVERLKELGFAYVTVDLEGFRSGSMNEAIQ